MKLYQPGLDDVLVERMWETMMQSGDMTARYPSSYLSLHVFLTVMQPPTSLVFEQDDTGAIWFALWMERTNLRLGIASIWIREDKRHARAAYDAIILGLAHFFQSVDALIAYTSDLQVKKADEHFGFTTVATLPGVFEGKDAHLMTLTRADFEARRGVTAAQEA